VAKSQGRRREGNCHQTVTSYYYY